MDAPLALYRRYRPDTFADVIGQDHVTEPLSHALNDNRVNHAYLFSGPRGCGKTTSARIMARALNCEKGPTAVPCGTCESCVELARGGPGSIDVIEIDAASHGGVDDARDLREGAFFCPMKARYKVYIIDEAHMVTPGGFNALLKLVEEPPSHVRFIFATTEPDKVIGTIRSRTHHYPFRLVPPKMLSDYLVELCQREDVAIENTALPLVVRAGGGSVRDSLSVLDQLMGGAGPDGVSYSLAISLLGYTPDSLLDETADALAAGDGATAFGVVDKVIDTGQDPRRFAEDLLHRLRDLVVVSAVPDAASRGLIEMPEDQAERLAGQAARFGPAELTRAADIVSQGLTDMRGATAPRLLLELMCARILLPGLDDSAEGVGARLDRIERRLSVVGTPSSHAPEPSRQPPRVDEGPLDASVPLGRASPVAATPSKDSVSANVRDSGPPDAGAAHAEPRATAAEPPVPASEPTSSEPPSSAAQAAPASISAPGAGSGPPGELTLVDVRQLWPGVLSRVQTMKRYAWALLSQNAQVVDVRSGVITIGLVNAGARDGFVRGGHDEILRQALIDELGVDWVVEAIIDGGSEGVHATHQPALSALPGPATRTGAVARTAGSEAAKEAIRPTRGGSHTTDSDQPSPDVREDDEVVDSALTSQELLTRELGAEVIDDIRHGTA
ncbi:MAG: DNA polymerase III subunit gamma and tau [Propionibacteriales bacterium]|nr:DNA polymerase III subunit gamma and tau [Propionibacteriales bacterium]